MCHFLALRQTGDRLLGAHRMIWLQGRRYRIAPMAEGQVRRAESGNSVETMRWGFQPLWARPGQYRALARSETVAERRGFRTAFRSRRCIVYADGFYIGSTVRGFRRWFFFQLPDERPFAFAGVWTPYDKAHPSSHDSFAILTCPANATVGLVHERMPVILGEGFHRAWLDNSCADIDALRLMLRPWSDRVFEGWEVTPELLQRPLQDYRQMEAIGPKLRARKRTS